MICYVTMLVNMNCILIIAKITRWIVGVRFRLTPYDLLCCHVDEYELYIDNSLNNKYNIYRRYTKI
jgi:hypothetical protein